MAGAPGPLAASPVEGGINSNIGGGILSKGNAEGLFSKSLGSGINFNVVESVGKIGDRFIEGSNEAFGKIQPSQTPFGQGMAQSDHFNVGVGHGAGLPGKGTGAGAGM